MKLNKITTAIAITALAAGLGACGTTTTEAPTPVRANAAKPVPTALDGTMVRGASLHGSVDVTDKGMAWCQLNSGNPWLVDLSTDCDTGLNLLLTFTVANRKLTPGSDVTFGYGQDGIATAAYQGDPGREFLVFGYTDGGLTGATATVSEGFFEASGGDMSKINSWHDLSRFLK